MKGMRSLALLAGILVALVAYIYVVDRNRPLGDASDRNPAFASVVADEIEELEIRAESGELTRLRKTDGRWTIIEPVAADADESEISSILSTLASVDIQRVVDESPEDATRFGLDPARIEAAFRTQGETDWQRLLIGDAAPAGGDLYARTADAPRVFVISSFLESTFNRDTFALRDKRVLRFDRDAADAVELTRGSTSIQLAKTGSEWRLVQPIAARGDFGAIEGAIARLQSARMQGITAPEAADLRPFGLNRPTATIVVGTESSRATLLLGNTENAVVFAKDDSRPAIFTVAPTLIDDVFKDPADFRRRDLFDARAFNAERVEIQRGDQALAFEKTTGEDDAIVWKHATGADVDTTKVEDLLGRLTVLRADAFEAARHASLKTPALSVTVRFDSGRSETVTFGRSGEDVFASRADEPGSARVNTSDFDDAVAALDDVK